MRKTKEEAEITRQKILAAARRVFHQNGVAHSSLELVAKNAGVTRGAIYWHFKDKTALFFAMQQDACKTLDIKIHQSFTNPQWQNPLDAIAAGLKTFFMTLDCDPDVQSIFKIMALKCEYVGEFESVIHTLMQPAGQFLKQLEKLYQEAQNKNVLKNGLNPQFLAIDTATYVNGLVHYWATEEIQHWQKNIFELIDSHLALRRVELPQKHKNPRQTRKNFENTF